MNKIELSNSNNKNEENLSIQLNLDKNIIVEKRQIEILEDKNNIKFKDEGKYEKIGNDDYSK